MCTRQVFDNCSTFTCDSQTRDNSVDECTCIFTSFAIEQNIQFNSTTAPATTVKWNSVISP